MSVSISGIGLVAPISFQPVLNEITLEEVRDTKGDINEIRMLLKGNQKTCCSLFKKAVEEGDAVTQIQLSYALQGIKWGKDETKDFSSLSAQDLETFDYYPPPTNFYWFYSAYRQAIGDETWSTPPSSIPKETFQRAADAGYLPAFFELMFAKWKSPLEKGGAYGFAAELQPFVGKGDACVDRYFALALKNGCKEGSELYYEGLYRMNQLGMISVGYPKEGQSFDTFEREYRNSRVEMADWDQNGFVHMIGIPIILAPSEKAWKAFVEEKLKDVKIASPESYVFSSDPKQISSLLNKHNISYEWERVESSASQAHETEDLSKKPTYDLRLTFFKPCPGGVLVDGKRVFLETLMKEVGEISIDETTAEVRSKTVKNPEVGPIIEFVEAVMQRTHSVVSATTWLDVLKKQ